jgi:hypothetical protein
VLQSQHIPRAMDMMLGSCRTGVGCGCSASASRPSCDSNIRCQLLRLPHHTDRVHNEDTGKHIELHLGEAVAAPEVCLALLVYCRCIQMPVNVVSAIGNRATQHGILSPVCRWGNWTRCQCHSPAHSHLSAGGRTAQSRPSRRPGPAPGAALPGTTNERPLRQMQVVACPGMQPM